jgi:O-antigen ligase
VALLQAHLFMADGNHGERDAGGGASHMHRATVTLNSEPVPTSVRVVPARPSASAGSFRDALFLVNFLLLWLSLTPFRDLGRSDVLETVNDGALINQVAVLSSATALAAFVVRTGQLPALRAIAVPALIVTLAWFAASAALSVNADLALRRLVLALITLFQACAFVLIPRDVRHFARLLAIGSLIVVAICYFGVLFLPHLSIHQASDLAEPGLAGNWRGAFGHKNGAGGEMVVFIFIGLFAARMWSRTAGWTLAMLAGVFLYFTQAKSPLGLLPAVLLIPVLALRVRSAWSRNALLLTLPVVLSAITVGSVIVPAIRSMDAALMSDPSFTGRDVIWRFALDSIAARPLVGHGFQAFWGTGALVYNWNPSESWGMRASDAHNGFLNVAVMTGWIGLLAVLAWVVVQPLRDLGRLRGPEPDLTLLLVRVWLFGLCLSSFESVLFSGGSTLWFMMIVSIVSLRLQTISRLVR